MSIFQVATVVVACGIVASCGGALKGCTLAATKGVAVGTGTHAIETSAPRSVAKEIIPAAGHKPLTLDSENVAGKSAIGQTSANEAHESGHTGGKIIEEVGKKAVEEAVKHGGEDKNRENKKSQ